jgi:glucosamine-6-phosphate deaminase
MRLLIYNDYENVCRFAADYIVRRIKDFAPKAEKPFVLGLPTGSSPLGVYRNLIDACGKKEVSFANMITFNMDEYLGLESDHPQSYRRFMKDNFFSSIDIPPENTHLLDGIARDPEAECAAYEAAIKAAGGIELFLGGIGGNGHIAFNEPGSPFDSRTRVVNINAETRADNARFFDGNPAKVPARALTVGIGTVMDAREVAILASGRRKAKAIQAAVEGEVGPSCPLSCLRTHPNAIIVCDEEAAGELKYSTVKHFENLKSEEPENIIEK